MRCLARTSLGLLSLALMAPSVLQAQDVATSVPSGYQVAPASPDGQPMPMSMPAPVVEAPHKHRGKTICAKCAAKLKAASSSMPPGTIVGCEHSKNGVCTACQAALNMPGTFVMSPGQPPITAADPSVEAPGRAVASSGMSPSSNLAAMGRPQPAAYGENMAEPAPVGVVQANFSQGNPMMEAPAAYAPQAMAPGRAMVESAPGRDPYQAKSGPFPRPHILGHLFGWSGLGGERAEEKARRKAETHAMISYDKDAPAPVEELPASMVFGKKR